MIRNLTGVAITVLNQDGSGTDIGTLPAHSHPIRIAAESKHEQVRQGITLVTREYSESALDHAVRRIMGSIDTDADLGADLVIVTPDILFALNPRDHPDALCHAVAPNLQWDTYSRWGHLSAITVASFISRMSETSD